jgi:phosphoserine phosphatase RsbU/P
MYYVRTQTASAELGFTAVYDERERAGIVGLVEVGSPAARAGLETGDRIRGINGAPLDSRHAFNLWDRQPADREIVLTVERGRAIVPVRLVAHLPEGVPFSLRGLLRTSLLEVLAFFPVVFLAVGLAVLALRPYDPYAWLMAGLFACFLTITAFPRATSGLPPGLGRFVLAYRAIALPAIPALFYGFFAVFPARSVIDRALPWLKWLLVAGWMLFSLPNLGRGAPLSPPWMVDLMGAAAADTVRLGYLLSGIPLGIVALTLNATRAPTPEARRKARVLLWGTVAGAMPIMIVSMAQLLFGLDAPSWVNTGAVMMASIFPISFAYAVVRHRVLDIPVLLKRSARYLLVRRGFAVLLVLLAATVTGIFTLIVSQLFEINVTVATAAGVAFGVAMSAGSAPLVRRATTRIDRAFFRAAYDSTAILESLADEMRTASSRQSLATLLEAKISEALRPVTMAVFLEDVDGRLHPFASRGRANLPPLPVSVPFLQELARRGQPWDISQGSKEEAPQFLRDSNAEMLVPILRRDGRLAGMLVPGPRVSEEPYSGDDKRLLRSVASQAGVELDNIRLAETIAERLDAERAAMREIEIARQVQFRLFPQKQPEMRTLDYAGGCLQAQRVGGDYYDFVALGPGRVGLVVADISGKGIAGALLMANLQANLRSQYTLASDDLPRLLKSVNQLFFDNTAENQYATLFFADYADDTRTVRFANCGHFPPFLMRAYGTVEQLMPTAMVLGLFEAWSTTTCERQLHPGDTLVIYTDGVIEATNHQDQEFGNERLLATMREHRHLPAADLVTTIHAEVQRFSAGSLSDDLTVVVAKVR